MKKLIVGEAKTGKSKECFRLANTHPGTVVYFSGISKSEVHYEENADFYGFSGFHVMPKDKATILKNGEKYFFSPVNAVYSPLDVTSVVDLFNGESKNSYTEQITDPILLILDDGFFEDRAKDREKVFLQLSIMKSDVILSVTSWHTLLPNFPEEKIKDLCSRLGWDAETQIEPDKRDFWVKLCSQYRKPAISKQIRFETLEEVETILQMPKVLDTDSLDIIRIALEEYKKSKEYKEFIADETHACMDLKARVERAYTWVLFEIKERQWKGKYVPLAVMDNAIYEFIEKNRESEEGKKVRAWREDTSHVDQKGIEEIYNYVVNKETHR